ncbi:MAG: DUF4230 domain-containing protein [Verrucomicrobiia bacterium]
MKGIQGAAIFLVVVLIVSWQLRACLDHAARLPAQTARQTATAVQDILASFKDVLGITPRIQQGDTLVFEQTLPIEELAVLQRDFTFSYTWREQWLLGTKRLTASGTFRAKAGFDLSQPVSVLIDHRGRATADLPPAQILSVEPIGPLDFGEATEWFSRISPQERNQVKNQFFARARAHAAGGSLLADTETELTQRLIQRLGPSADQIQINFRQEAPSPAP